MLWQLQEGKQRFSELIRSAQTEGPQVVTRHGEEVAVVVDINEFRRLKGSKKTFKDLLVNGPDFDELVFDDRDYPRELDVTDFL